MEQNGISNGEEDSWKRLDTEWPNHPNVSTEEIINQYDKWDDYDKDMSVLGYHAADALCSYFCNLGLNKDALILDVGCGTGIVGVQLKENGYTCVHGHDGCDHLLDKARQKNAYQKYIHCTLGGGNTLPMEDGTYDAVITAGGMSPGHFPLDSFKDMFRVLKPGGYFAHVCREANLHTAQHSGFTKILHEESAKGNITILTDEIFGDYYKNTIDKEIPGRVQVIQKLTKTD